jgi:hypothetical protein
MEVGAGSNSVSGDRPSTGRLRARAREKESECR